MLTGVTTQRALGGFLLARKSLPPASVRQTMTMALALIRRSLAAARIVQVGIALAPAAAIAESGEAAERLSRFALADRPTDHGIAVAPSRVAAPVSSAVTVTNEQPASGASLSSNKAAAVAGRARERSAPASPAPASIPASVRAGLVTLIARGDAVPPAPGARDSEPVPATDAIGRHPSVLQPRRLVERLQPASTSTTAPSVTAPLLPRRAAEVQPMPQAAQPPVRPASVRNAATAAAARGFDTPDVPAAVRGTTMALLPRQSASGYSVVYAPARDRGAVNSPAAGLAAPRGPVPGDTPSAGAPANDADADFAVAKRFERAAAEAEAVLDLERRLEAILRADLQRHGIDF
jgi:hypothetical protein